MSVKIYHNSNCSKCRLTMELLEEASITPDVVEYLVSPPNRDELIEILAMLDISPRELMRTHESEYMDNSLDDESLSSDALIDAMIRFPILIERPIVISNGKAVIGRPPVNVKTII